MPNAPDRTFTVFVGEHRIAVGPIQAAANAAKRAYEAGEAPLLIFDDLTGRLVELDLRGPLDNVPEGGAEFEVRSPSPAGRGRPRLGVTAREITLLPSHWEWLARQPGGASATLRRLVDQARRSGLDRAREGQEAAHRVMLSLAGDAPRFEDALRAFYAKDYASFEGLSESWPKDVRDYVLAFVRRVAAAESSFDGHAPG